MTRKGVLRGRKINQRHSTFIPATRPIIMAAKALPCVKKVVLGQIVPVGAAEPRLKITPIPGGIKAQVRGTAEQQDLFIYTSDVPKTERRLREVWEQR